MLAGMTCRQFDERFAANKLDPWPEDRSDENFAVLCDLLCKLNGRNSTITNWLPKWDAEPKPAGQHEANMQAETNIIAEAWNKRANDEASSGS